MATFELRTYTPADGRLGDLLERFREHTVSLLERHGMEAMGYWLTADPNPRLVYILRHEGDPVRNWDAFRRDPEWLQVFHRSERAGPLTDSITTVWLEPTDFSPSE